MTPPPVIGPAGLALRDVQDGPVIAFVVRVAHPDDDVRSVRLDLSDCVVGICCLGLDGAVADDLLARIDWRLRDRRAPL